MDTAGLGIRIVAGLIDLIIVGIIFYLVAFLTGQTTQSGFELTGFPALVAFIIGLLYYFAFEALTGATPGKMVCSLRVVGVEGGNIDWRQSAIRNVLRLIDGIVFYLVAIILIATSEKRQRLGDRVAGTLVVRGARS